MMPLPEHPKKRFRTPSPLSKGRSRKESRRHREQNGPSTTNGDSNDNFTERKEQESFAREQTRLNQIQEAEQMREWVSKEDEFVLQQSKKKAHIRVREGRAKNIDWLTVTLSVIDPTTDPLEDEINDTEVDIVDPAGIFEGLNHSQLEELGKEISSYLTLENSERNRRYWSVRCADPMRFLALTAFRPSKSFVETTRCSLPPPARGVDHLMRLQTTSTDCLAPKTWKSSTPSRPQSPRNWIPMSQSMLNIGSSC